MSEENTSVKKLYEIDFIRAVCCVLVVIIHVTASFWHHPQGDPLTFKVMVGLNTFARFAVPCFLFISGFTLYYFYSQRKFSLIAFYQRRLSKVLFPYLLWSTFYTAINYSKYINPSGGFYWGKFFKHLILGLSSYHLYFLVILIQLYLLFPALLWLYQRINHPLWGLLCFAGISLGFIFLTDFPLRDRLFPYYLLYFTVAFSFADLKLKGQSLSKGLRWSLFLCYFASLLYYCVDNYRAALEISQISWQLFIHIFRIYGILGSIVMYLWAEKLQQSHWKGIHHPVVSRLSQVSFTIYLVHPFVLMVYRWLELRLPLEQLPLSLAFPFKLAVVFIGSLGFAFGHATLKGSLQSCRATRGASRDTRDTEK